MTDENYEAEIAAEAEAEQWWNELRMRSVGTVNIPEWSHLWISVLLRRYEEKQTKGQGLNRFRTFSVWATLIHGQLEPSDPEPPEYRDQILDFLREQHGPWLMLYDQRRDKWAIRQVGTLEEDIAFARDEQRKRMDEEQRLREEADRRVLSLQMSKGPSILPS